MTYFAQYIPLEAKASGKAAVGLIRQYGTVSVSAPLTKT